MANEIGPSIDGVEAGGGVREDVNKVTEEAVRRVQDNQKKAKQAQQQIQQDKQNNAKFAHFLTFLLKTIKNEKLITSLYEVFFKTKHPKTEITYLRKNINTIVIVGMFAPFFPTEIEELGLKSFFDTILSAESKPNITEYLAYLKQLSKTYHDNVPMDKTAFIKFLTELLMEFDLVNREAMTEDQTEELQRGLQKELYGK
ncbi:MAG: hypothetical protein NTX91_03815 [candidate division SR1 bacterium]|nr:hypothetical protein [candidate division SR1 bacterium]